MTGSSNLSKGCTAVKTAALPRGAQALGCQGIAKEGRPISCKLPGRHRGVLGQVGAPTEPTSYWGVECGSDKQAFFFLTDFFFKIMV